MTTATAGAGYRVWGGAAAEREGNIFKGFKDICLEKSSSQGQNLALTVLNVPSSLDGGRADNVASRGKGGAPDVGLPALTIFRGLTPPAASMDREAPASLPST